jgi:ABC-2 type transport system permease protein
MVPFFSPVVMMVRIPFHPPVWQLALSMVLMVLGFLGTVWVAGRIYRTGILLYGKKITFAELGKWLFYKS